MTDTWRFVLTAALIFAIGMLLPLAVDAAFPSSLPAA